MADLSEGLVSQEAAPTYGPVKSQRSWWAANLENCPSPLRAAFFRNKNRLHFHHLKMIQAIFFFLDLFFCVNVVEQLWFTLHTDPREYT